MHTVGIMQGRLVPQVNGRIQAFPAQRWREEFALARQHGFDAIEFVFESYNYESNPLYTDAGIADINTLRTQTGVEVPSICADYFMTHPFPRVGATERSRSIAVLERLIDSAQQISARRIEIPCVDQAAIVGEGDKRKLLEAISSCLPLAERAGVELVFETSLPPAEFRDLLERFGHSLVRANYDTGNSASLGYDPIVELRTLGSLISNVHIKDRVLHGNTVPLGAGAAHFPDIFRTLAEIRYQGDFILQTARDPDHLGVAVRYRDFVRAYLSQYFHD